MTHLRKKLQKSGSIQVRKEVTLKNNAVKNNSKISFQFQQYIFPEKADSMTDKDRATVIKLVDEDRRYWLQAAIVRIMKWQKKANFNHLVQEIQKEAGRRFQDLV